MSIPNPKFKPESGSWQKQPNGLVMWSESTPYGIPKLYAPTDLINISKSAEFRLAFIREIADPNKFNGKITRYFAQDVKIMLRDDTDPNVVLKFSNKRYFISDLSPLGQTFLAPIDESNEYLVVQKSEPYLVSQKEAMEIMQTSNYAYGKVEVDAQGNLTYLTTV
jgi:hypothetical protein